MSTEPQNAPVTEAHEKLLREIYSAVDPAKLIANFVASETAALKEMHAGLATSLNEIQNEKLALAAQCALLREALTTARKSCAWSYSNSLGSQEIMWELAKDALKATDKALAATPETASAELAELRKDKERLDWMDKQDRYCFSFEQGDTDVGVFSAWRIMRHIGKCGENLWEDVSNGEQLRSAIDAARNATP